MKTFLRFRSTHGMLTTEPWSLQGCSQVQCSIFWGAIENPVDSIWTGKRRRLGGQFYPCLRVLLAHIWNNGLLILRWWMHRRLRRSCRRPRELQSKNPEAHPSCPHLWDRLATLEDPQISYHIQCVSAIRLIYVLRCTLPHITLNRARLFDSGPRRMFQRTHGLLTDTALRFAQLQ